MGLVKHIIAEQEAFDDFIALVLDEAEDNLATRPEGAFAQMKLKLNPNDTGETVDGILYDFPDAAQPTQHVFVPDHNPRKYVVMPANDWVEEAEDEDLGYHNLRASDL